MAKIKIDAPEKRPEDHYPTPEVPGIKPNVNETPVMYGTGMCKKDGLWYSYDIKFKGEKILEINYSEPDIRMVIQMDFKVRTQRMWEKLIQNEEI